MLQYLLLICLISSSSVMAEGWRVFFYMDATDNLTDMAFKNLTDMIRGRPKSDVQIYVQLHAYGQSGLRYFVTKNGLEFCEEILLTGKPQTDFENGLNWGFTNCSKQRRMLILANHGWGVLDPEWNPLTEEWQAGIASLSNSCTLKSGCLAGQTAVNYHYHHKHHRGYMFSVVPRAYLTNAHLEAALAAVQPNLLQGQKLDAIAFDTCMGAMLEVADLLAPYAQYLLGVQSCALVDGFDYQNFIQVLNQTDRSTEVVLTSLVHGFNEYYSKHDPLGIYTLSALDLAQTTNVCQALDLVAKLILADRQYIQPLQKARDQAHRFCLWPMYADPANFLQQFEAACAKLQIMPTPELQAALSCFYQALAGMVVARCGGFTTLNKAYGCAIYLPNGSEVYASYFQTKFARDSNWPELLQLICSS